MKLYVEEQDMPPNCAECKAEGHYENSYGDEYGFFCPFGYKAYTSGTRDTKRLDNCPLIPIPPHGDLIDLKAPFKAQYFDEMTEEWIEKMGTVEDVLYSCMVDEMPPITIPAEEGET